MWLFSLYIGAFFTGYVVAKPNRLSYAAPFIVAYLAYFAPAELRAHPAYLLAWIGIVLTPLLAARAWAWWRGV